MTSHNSNDGHVGTPKKAAVASLIGSSLEWYDFFLYGTAAAIVIGPLFFPSHSSVAGTLQAFATFAIGFFARPFGGVVFSHFGDRLGRRNILVITLLMMGLASTLIGVLPTYAQAGALAPALLILLRIIQGFAVGGEWGGSVLLITEHASHRRGFFSSFSQVGIMLGFVLSAGLFALIQQLLTHDAFMAWGWRIPFLVSIILTIGGLVIRMKVEETPEFKSIQSKGQIQRVPALEALRTYPKQIAIAVGARMAENGGSYIFLVFAVAYAEFVGLDSSTALIAATVATILEMFTVVMWGALSDKIGRRPVYLIGSIGVVLWAFPFFALIDSGQTINMYIAIIVAVAVCHGAMIGSQPAFFSELFKGEVRYSGVSIGHEVAAIIAGGIAPLIATALLAAYGTYWPIAIYLGILGLITTVAVAASRETLDKREQDTLDQPRGDRLSTTERGV